MRSAIPFAIFLALVAFLAFGLWRDPRVVPSALIDKPAPSFQLSQLHEPDKVFSAQEMRGRVWLLNTWASWCISCREEHPLLVQLSETGAVPIYGLNYKDTRGKAMEWLREFGNPYVLSVEDTDGRVGIDYGVYGIPETYLIDKAGVIRFKQIGPVTPQVLKDTILPMVRELEK